MSTEAIEHPVDRDGEGPNSATTLARISLVALVVLSAIQMVRVFLPIVFDLGERGGTTAGALEAGGLAMLVSLAPLLAPLAPRALGPRRGLMVSIAGAVVARLAVQVIHPVPLWLAGVGTAIALIALALLLAATSGTGSPTFAFGVLAGLSVDTALRGAFWSWDYAWQDGAIPLAVMVAAAAATVLFAFAQPDPVPPTPSRARARTTAVIGPFLFLQVLFLQSPAFVASQGGVSVQLATAVVLAGDAAAMLLAVRAVRGAVSGARLLAGAVALVILAAGLRGLHGVAVLPLVIAGSALTGAFLAIGLRGEDRPHAAGSFGRVGVAFALGSLGFVLLLVLYQIGYRIALPFPNTVLAPVAVALLFLGAMGSPSIRPSALARHFAYLWILPAGLVLVPALVALLASSPKVTVAEGPSLRLVSFNVHLGIGEAGQLDPEATAKAIEAMHPDVVALQEVARGWPGAGTIDLAGWLSHRLGIPFAYAPAADRQFGNAVLSRFPLVGSKAIPLPRVNGHQVRSYLWATIDLGNGRRLNFIDAHLEGSDPDHQRQARLLLKDWNGAPATVIAGDMNMQPDDPDRSLFDAAGLVSIQDGVGLAAVSTASDPKFPGDRVDWIFATPDLSFVDFRLGQSGVSDHRALAATFEAN